MSFTLFASQCPTPQFRNSFLSISAAGNAANAPVSDRFNIGLSTGLVGTLNRNATRQDLTGSFGGGAYFVAVGLSLAAGTGLSVAISAGTAMIDGAVNVETASALPVPASFSRVFIWLLQTGILTYTQTTAPPGATACFLGSVVTSATAVTSVDYSGVLYGSGILQRTTADAGQPTDTPPAGLHFYTVTAGGSYYWNGTAYANIAGKNGTNGTAATVTVGTVTTGAAGSSATVANSGTSSAAVFNFTIPQGAAGSGGSGSGVSSIAAADSTLTLGGTASAPTLALNLGNSNTWTAAQNFSSATVSGNLNLSGSFALPGSDNNGNPGFHFGSVGSANSYGDNLGMGLDRGYNIVLAQGSAATRFVTNTGATPLTVGPSYITATVPITTPSLQVNGTAVVGSVTITLAASTQSFSAAGRNYLVTADFHAAGTFSDAFYESSLSASNTTFTVSQNEGGRTAGAMSWIVYVPTGQTSLSSISLTASLRGRGWSGSSSSGVAATWTLTQLA